ncbi:hypothetical protein OESDEN_16068, partial [Oesophagostomum dentatum]
LCRIDLGFAPVVVPRFTLFINTILFELKKRTIRWKCSLARMAKRGFAKHMERKQEYSHRTITNPDYTLKLELGEQLSSITPLYSTGFSSFFFHSSHRCSKKITDLDETLLLRIARYLDGQCVLAVAQVCGKPRRIVAKNITTLERKKSSPFDLFIDFNKRTGREDVRALKQRRRVRDAAYSGGCIRDVIPPLLLCQLRISFGNNVSVSHWIAEINALYNEKRLIPISLNFSGGTFTRGIHAGGADLRCFTEPEFTTFIGSFIPHLEEVQLATARLFKLNLPSRFLFTMINLLSVFGVVYERPPLRYSINDLCKIIYMWRNSATAHSCEVYIPRTHGFENVNWSQLGGAATLAQSKVTYIRIRHAFLDNVVLTFHL